MRVPLALVLCAAALAPACGALESSLRGDTGIVSFVADGDTLRLRGAGGVRLVQVDAPEIKQRECYAREARAHLLRLAPVGSAVTLDGDPRLDDRDGFGRRLRYVSRGELNVNLELVRVGAAAPYFFRGARGRHASELLAAARRAQARKLGLWGACPRTRLNPNRQVATGSAAP